MIGPGGVTAFASGGVVGGPTMFGYRGGAGLMGEAGPEAIMPLKRGSNGALGVQVHDSGAKIAIPSRPQSIEINVNVSGARGNSEIKEMVNQGVAAGLKQYDASALPGRVMQVSKNPRVRG